MQISPELVNSQVMRLSLEISVSSIRHRINLRGKTPMTLLILITIIFVVLAFAIVLILAVLRSPSLKSTEHASPDASDMDATMAILAASTVSVASAGCDVDAGSSSCD
jgi:hypothetical protein